MIARVSLAAFLLAVPALAQDTDAVARDLKQLQGEWKAVSADKDGQPPPADVLENLRMTFTKDKILVHIKDERKEVSFKIDPGKKPKAIDVTPAEGPQAGKVVPGIYEVTGETLRLAFAEGDNAKRPESFTPKAGSNLTVLTLKKMKS